jgi:RNA polymerase sigma factor (sigma-70 family)
MCIVHGNEGIGATEFRCAQAGCRACQDSLVRQHDGLVHYVLRRYVSSELSYEELLQVGRIGLWRAVLGYDVQRGIAFSTYAVVAIRNKVWTASQRSQSAVEWGNCEPVDARAEAEEQLWRTEVYGALAEAVARLPERPRQVIVAVYGLDGQAPRTLAVIGHEWGISHQGVSYWHTKALSLLRLPPIGGRLRQVYGRDSQADHVRSQKLNRVWRRRRRRRR